MSGPDWEKQFSDDYNVLVAWEHLEQGNASLTSYFRFAKYGRNILNSHVVTNGAVSPDYSHGIDLKGYYHGCINSISPLRQSVGTELQPRIIFPTITLALVRDDSDEIREFLTVVERTKHLSDYSGYARVYVVKCGTDIDPVNDLYYEGVVDRHSVNIFPDRIEVSLSDQFAYLDDVELPAKTYSSSDFPELDDDAEGLSIPILFGATEGDPLSGGINGRMWLPITCTRVKDTAAGNPAYWFKLCDPMSQGIQFASGQTKIYVLNPDGSFKTTYEAAPLSVLEGRLQGVSASHDGSDWTRGERFYIRGHSTLGGNLDDSGTLIENPATIWYLLLTHYAGVPESMIDSGWMDVRDYLDEGLLCPIKARCFLWKPRKLTTILEDLCSNFGLLTFVHKGKFRLNLGPIYREQNTDTQLVPNDILHGGFQVRSFFGPKRQSIVRVYYGWQEEDIPKFEQADPPVTLPDQPFRRLQNEVYAMRTSAGPTGADAVESLGMNWIGETATAEMVARLFSGFVNSDATQVDATVIKRMMQGALGQVTEIAHPSLDRTLCAQVLERNTDLWQGLTSIKAVDIARDDE